MQESGEMYLESIFVLSRKSSSIRSVDLAEHMNYSKPSVSRAIGILKNDGYICVDENGFISLTEAGTALAEKIYERHIILTKALNAIGVDEKTAEEDACRVEHIISDETFSAIKKHLEARLG